MTAPRARWIRASAWLLSQPMSIELAERALPVWRCSRCCDVQWVSESEETSCPHCLMAGETAGYTYGEVVDACARFGCQVPIHRAQPVPEVIQLSTLPRELWEGMPVFHPLSQDGDRASWLSYDVGIVVEVQPDPDVEGFRCRFVWAIGEKSGSLRYSADNLWVPKVLADRLAASAGPRKR
jgi:hypothetical protein